jgi:thioredoxin reductase (NADPH)
VDVTQIDLKKKEVVIDEYETIKAKKIIIATGTTPNLLGIPGEKELKGRGISYCATCDAKNFEGKDVVVIGGGNSAVEESDFIARFARKITMVHQFDTLTSNKMAQEKILSNPDIEILFEHEPRSFTRTGDKMITEVEDLKTHTLKKLESDGVFIFIGMKPNVTLFKDLLHLDSWNYIKTDEDKRTNLRDVFAVGDVTSKKYRQITTAVADGTIAAIAIAKELN